MRESTLTWPARSMTSTRQVSVTCRGVWSTSRRGRARASASRSASLSPTSTPRTTTSGRGRRSSALTSAATTTWRREKASTSTAPASSGTESSYLQIRPGYHAAFSRRSKFEHIYNFNFAAHSVLCFTGNTQCAEKFLPSFWHVS